MNANELAKLITKREGKRLSLSIAQVKEVLGIVSDYLVLAPEYRDLLIKLGKRRAKAAESVRVKAAKPIVMALHKRLKKRP